MNEFVEQLVDDRAESICSDVTRFNRDFAAAVGNNGIGFAIARVETANARIVALRMVIDDQSKQITELKRTIREIKKNVDTLTGRVDKASQKFKELTKGE